MPPQLKKILQSKLWLVFRNCYKILKNETLSQEAVQETFVSVLKNYEKLVGLAKSDILPYSVRVLKNTCYNIYNREKRERHVPLEEVDYDEALTKQQRTEYYECDTFISMQAYRKLILRLTETEQRVLTLKIVEDFSNRQIAKKLDLSTGNVGVILHRALKRLRELLTEEEQLVK